MSGVIRMAYIIQQSDVGRTLDGLVKSLKKPKFMAQDMDLPVCVCENLWFEWCTFRKAMKKPISKMAANKQLKLLAKYTVTEQCAIIDSSIQNDEQGSYDLKAM